MGFGPFAILSLFYVVIGVRFVFQLVRAWRPTFDKQFTVTDRYMVDQAAFFLLVPISVALHELGHAVAVWSLGGEVTGFGFFFFAGYVSYSAPFTDAEQILVAAAGAAVNLVLCLGAIGFVLLKRPPLRAPLNELLIQFAFLSGVNAFIFYPLLDFASGLDGDWNQMYRGDVPALSAAILVIHLGILGLGWWLWKDSRMAARFASLTSQPRGTERRLLGGLRAGQTRRPAAQIVQMTPAERLLNDAGQRVSSGWPEPVQVNVETNAQAGSILTLAWQRGDQVRAVAARALGTGAIDIFGGTGSRADGNPAALTIRTRIQQVPPPPDVDQLTLALRLGMEEVDRWTIA